MISAAATAPPAIERTVLIVSPHFPPSSLAGVHRARHLAKYLPAHGWRPIIIRVDESHYTERPDRDLAKLVPPEVRQFRTGAIPAALTRCAGIGDIGLRGYLPIKRAIARAAAQFRLDVVLITGSPYYPMLLAGWVKRQMNIPVVLDFQDPWVSNEGAARLKWSKGDVAHRLAVLLEPHAIKGAAFITSVSETQNAQMLRRYPWLEPRRMAAITIGGDPDDFDFLRAHPLSRPQVRLNTNCINLSYVGTFLPRAGGLVRALFRAARGLKQSDPELAARLRLNFVGTSNQPNGSSTYTIRPIAEQEGVADLVAETPQRVPYLEALHILANSHGVLLIGSDEPHYTASKIYPALMSGRPFLSLFHKRSSAHAILSAAGGGAAFAFDDLEDLAALVPELCQQLYTLAIDPLTFGKADPAAYAEHTAHAVAGQFAEIFERTVSREDTFGR